MFRFVKSQQKTKVRHYNDRCGSLNDLNVLREGKNNLDKLNYTCFILNDQRIKLDICNSLPENNYHLKFEIDSNICTVSSLLQFDTFKNINNIKPTNIKNNFDIIGNNHLNVDNCNIVEFKESKVNFLKMLKEYNINNKYLYIIDKIAQNSTMNDLLGTDNLVKKFDDIKNEIVMGIDINGFFDVNFCYINDTMDKYIKYSLQKHTLYYADKTVIIQISLYDKLSKLGVDTKICLSYLPIDTKVSFDINTTSDELINNCNSTKYRDRNVDLLLKRMEWIVSPFLNL